MVEIPQIFQSPEFKRLFILSEIDNFTADDYLKYEYSLKRMSDYYNIIDSAVAKAEKVAREERRAEGLAEGRTEMCRRMLAMGFLKDKVAEAVGMSLEELEELL